MKQLKRLTSVLLVLGIVLGLMPLSAFAAKPENTAETTFTVTESDNGGVDTYTFMLLDDGTVKLTAFSTTAAAAYAVIPSTAQGHPVTSIGIGAFANCDKLKTVKLPDSVTSVGTASFYECMNLNEVNLGNSVVSIGANAFMHCMSMKKLTIPQSIEVIGDGAFYYKYGVKKQLEKLHYTGTEAQWDELAKKYDFENMNPMLTEPEEFHCAHTVSFECGSQAKGSTKVVQYGEKVTPPAEPTAKGYRFEGWYAQENGGTLFNFNQAITEDVTVYARWSKVEPAPDPAKAYTLTEKDGSLVCVTVVENGTTVDITKNVGMKKQGTTQIGKIPAGAMVTVAANAAPEGMVFAHLKYLLPSGAALPQNRIQLAELLWRNAGEPVPDANAAYEDIGLNDEAAQQAAQWVLENELMELPDEEHTGQFKPDERISYGEAIRAWKKAQQLKTAE